MCIFFFVIGDKTHPTILCNNRDEYFVRSTARGAFYQDNQRTPVDLTQFPTNQNHIHYVPYDLEAGGTWFSFDSLHDTDRQGVRFAVVLNLDNHSVPTSLSLDRLRSRGRLVHEFLSLDPFSQTAAAEYATEIFSKRDQYRPFNLIICDGFGHAYYITSSIYQKDGPELLSTGILYGISNGYLHDTNWEKVTLGKHLLRKIVDPSYFAPILQEEILPHIINQHDNLCYHLDQVSFQQYPSFASRILPSASTCMHQHSLPNLSEFSGSKSATTGLAKYVQSLYEVMTDTHPCADPEYGHQYSPLVSLASIFASPIRIDANVALTDPNVTSYYVPGFAYQTPANGDSGMNETATIAESENESVALPIINNSNNSNNKGNNTVDSNNESKDKTESNTDVPPAIRARYQLLWNMDNSNDLNNNTDPTLLRQIFGTRTITIMIHLSPHYLAHHANIVSHTSEGNTTGKKGYFMLLEDDINMVPLAETCQWKQLHNLHYFQNLPSGV